MQDRLNSEHSALQLFPKEIWQFIFTLSNINLRDISSLLQASFVLSQFVHEMVTIVYKKHFPRLYRKLPAEAKKNITVADLKTAYKSDYAGLKPEIKKLFSYTKDGELDKIQSLPSDENNITILDENTIKIIDAAGFTLVDWARKNGHVDILNYFYSTISIGLVDRDHIQLRKLIHAIDCLQPLTVIDDVLLQLIAELNPMRKEIYYVTTFSRAARVGYIQLLNAFLPTGKYSFQIRPYHLKGILSIAITYEEIEALNLLLEIAREQNIQFDRVECIKDALRTYNKDILIALLNDSPKVMPSLFFVFNYQPDLAQELLTHPNLRLTDEDRVEICQYSPLLIKLSIFDAARDKPSAPEAKSGFGFGAKT